MPLKTFLSEARIVCLTLTANVWTNALRILVALAAERLFCLLLQLYITATGETAANQYVTSEGLIWHLML